jgi:ABC-2 type transport system permease protein
VLVPLRGTAGWLGGVSLLMPLRYVVDLTRAAYYADTPGYEKAVVGAPTVDAAVTLALTVTFLALGTALFIYRERNR